MIVNNLFEVKYGVNMELNALEMDASGINFVSRTSKNNGVSAKVRIMPDVEPIPAGTISVAASGSVMESFLQTKPYYSGRDLYYLLPRRHLSDKVLLFYCLCLKSNRYKFSYGRQANISLKKLEIPAPHEIPKFVKSFSLIKYKKNLLKSFSFDKNKRTSKPTGSLIKLDVLFDIYNGIASSEVKRIEAKVDDSCIPYIRPSYRQETSIDAFVSKNDIESKYIFPPETLYVSTDGQGSHSYAYVSTFEFVPNSNVSVLIPKDKMTLSEKLYYAHCISINRYKFSYGRKPKGERLKTIMLPDAPPFEITDGIITKILNKWSEEK